jgi:HSP20 family protein
MNRNLSNSDIFDIFFSRDLYLGDLPIDIFQTQDDYLILVDVPGIEPADISVTVPGNCIRIEAQRKSKFHLESRFKAERKYGELVRVINVDWNIKQEDITATIANGVLEIRVKISNNPAPDVKVEVKTG